MIKVTLPDGSIKELEQGSTPMDVAQSISAGLARNVISAKYNDTIVETSTPLTTDGNLTLYTWNDDEGKQAFWHSTSHVMAQAIQDLYPGAKLTIGPAIENGFYYDVDFGEQKISESDFSKIENRMLEIARGKHDFKMREVTKKEALDYYKKINNPFKVELIENLEDGTITFWPVRYKHALEILLNAKEVKNLLIIHTPSALAPSENYAQVIVEALNKLPKMARPYVITNPASSFPTGSPST